MLPDRRMDDWLEQERLHFAAGDGDLPAVQALVTEGRDINAADSDLGLTPLHYAAAGEHIDVVRFLIANGADVNAINETTAGDTPLGHVAQECSLAMAKTLLDAGANPLIPGMMLLTPLHRAERRKRPEGRPVYELLRSVARSRFRYHDGGESGNDAPSGTLSPNQRACDPAPGGPAKRSNLHPLPRNLPP